MSDKTIKMIDGKGRVVLVARTIGNKAVCSFMRYPDMTQEEINALSNFLDELKKGGAIPKEENSLDTKALEQFLKYKEEADEFCG
jgi:hypothetical protein